MFPVFKDNYSADGLLARLKEFSAQLQDLVFPGRCLKCRQYTKRDTTLPFSDCFCPACLEKELPFFLPPFCSQCGHVFASRTGENHLCGDCIKTDLPIGRVRAVFEYKGIIREAIPLFKYHSKLCLASVLEAFLFKALESQFSPGEIDSILPIPLHGQKVRKRGFNQSFLMVRHFKSIHARSHGENPCWTIDTRSLVRVRPTPSQTGLSIQEREKNLNQAFRVRSGSSVAGKHILLVDDVYTTGATCKAAAKTLLKAGAGRVDALVLARA